VQDGQAGHVAYKNESYARAYKFDVLKHPKHCGRFFLNTIVSLIDGAKKGLLMGV
jgi:hypothetical protein